MDQINIADELLRCGAVFYERFEIIDGYKTTSSKRSLVSDLFAISAAVFEVVNLPAREIRHAQLVNWTYDSFFMGRDDHIKGCMDALAKANLVQVRDIPKLKIAGRKNGSHTSGFNEGQFSSDQSPDTDDPTELEGRSKIGYQFNSEYMAILRAYTVRVWPMIAGEDKEIDESYPWQIALQLIFDFFKLRYAAEWFLLMRRTLRSSGASEALKQKIRKDLYSGRMTWTYVHEYLKWAYHKPEGTLLESEFRPNLPMFRAEYENDSVANQLVKLGFCTVTYRGGLVLRDVIREPVFEYDRNVTRTYGELRQQLRALLERKPR